MLRSRMVQRSVLILMAATFAGYLLTGCAGKDDKASAPGYYDGPMAKKGSPKMPGGGGKAGDP